MTTTFARLLLWSPRVLGLLSVLFIGMFALDAFGEDKPLAAAVADFGIHLIPALGLAAIVAASFRWPLAGGIGFIALAVVYAASAPRLDWILLISGPLAVVGALFVWSWAREHARNP
jgi:hypothetical protein